MKDPAFLLYVNDFQSGTQDMSCEEVGAYFRLLMYQHQHEFIPLDKEKMMRITGIFSEDDFNIIWESIKNKFNQTDNHLVNQRLNQEVNRRLTYKNKKMASAVFAGLISSNQNLTAKQIVLLKESFDVSDYLDINYLEIKNKVKEWFYNLVNQMVNNIENENIINSNNSNNSNKIVREEEEEEEEENCITSTFDEAWNLYDKKVGDKNKLKKKWYSLTIAERRKALSEIPRYVKSTPEKKYRKNFETYINNKSFNDEIINDISNNKNYGIRIGNSKEERDREFAESIARQLAE